MTAPTATPVSIAVINAWNRVGAIGRPWPLA